MSGDKGTVPPVSPLEPPSIPLKTSVAPKTSSRPTGKPPVDFPKVLLSGSYAPLESTIPPSSGLNELHEEFILPERRFFDRLDDRARRAELLTALLQAKGMSPARGVRALQAALGALVASAEEAHLPTLASLALALQTAIGQLGIVQESDSPTRALEVLVFDETEVSRDIVSLAVEAQGHHVRCANSYDNFVRQLDERLPDLIVTEIELSNAPARHFCASLVDLLASRPIPFIFFSAVPRAALAQLAQSSRAHGAISKDDGLAMLLPELERVLNKL